LAFPKGHNFTKDIEGEQFLQVIEFLFHPEVEHVKKSQQLQGVVLKKIKPIRLKLTDGKSLLVYPYRNKESKEVSGYMLRVYSGDQHMKPIYCFFTAPKFPNDFILYRDGIKPEKLYEECFRVIQESQEFKDVEFAAPHSWRTRNE